LDGAAKSKEAKALAAAVLEQHEATLAPQGRQRRQVRLEGVRVALEAVLCDLIGAAGLRRWSNRGMGQKDFTGQRVSYRFFNPVRTTLAEAGLVEELPFFLDRSGFGPVGRVTCLRLTDAGLALVREHGIAPSNHGQHFELEADRKAWMAQAMDL
jgi:hypothetical protein